MSAIVCGKRNFFEDYTDYSSTSSPNPVSKRLRCASSTSPVRFSLSSSPPPPPLSSGVFDRLRELFPLMDQELINKALEVCGDDIDAAIKRLNEMCLGSSEGSASANHVKEQVGQVGSAIDGETDPNGETSAQNGLPTDGTQWVELFVREMTSATSVDDARARAARVLEALEKSITANANATAENYHKENIMLKEQYEGLTRENSILKRAVQIQHERSKEFDDKNQEVEQLKHLLSQYQEQLRGLEVTNYALSMHLKQAQQSSSIPGRFHPDIF
ncbi:uncharacterized protein LOC141610834 [Silene latifolia]|uniref:uncharacterized protein LOC141610834 n=1 Tax=Silene latifolia TaxID=37657 RepID=UPI003D770CFC